MNDFIVGVLMRFTAEDQEHAIEQFYDSLSDETPDVNTIVENGSIEDLGQIVRTFIPSADWSEDNDGQLVIYTNLRLSPSGELWLV